MIFLLKTYYKLKKWFNYQKCAAFHNISEKNTCSGAFFDRVSLDCNCFDCPYAKNRNE